jgi:translation initiation factor IF-2
MSGRKILLLLNQQHPLKNGMQRNWMGRPMFFQTASRALNEESATATSGLGKPTGVKKTKGLAKTNWNRPQQSSGNTNNNRTQQGNSNNRTSAAGNANAAGRRVAPKRDWSKPVDQHVEKHAGETYKMHERHVNKFSKLPPKRTETQAQKRERKKREEELMALAREEEKERHQIAIRKAKLKAKEQAESNQIKDVYIPEIINAANLSRVLGIRIGKL